MIATAKNQRHAQALARTLIPLAKAKGIQARRQSGLDGDSGWALLDFDTVVVHLFDEERRVFYALEDLYADVPKVEFTPRERPESEEQEPQPWSTSGDFPSSGGNFPDSAWPSSLDEV